MEKEEAVSFWLGTVDRKKSLDELLRVLYTEDGVYIPSEVARLFIIDRYEVETREAEFFPNPISSFDKVVIWNTLDQWAINIEAK